MIRRLVLAGLCLLACGCHPALGPGPWPAPRAPAPSLHARVRTLNDGYDRARSTVLVREIDAPTRANLDYAAYHANFMIAATPPEAAASPATAGGPPHTARPFQGVLEPATLTADLVHTPLTDDERVRPLAVEPLVEYLSARKVAGAGMLEDVVAAIHGETWGAGGGGPPVSAQGAAEVYVHHAPGTPELWVKVEFQPWFKGL